MPHGVRAGSENDAAADARKAYSAKEAKAYTYKFDSTKPFLPSNMQTDTGEFIDPKSFPTAQYCQHCHQAAHAQWRQSAHANSNRVPYYLRNVNLLIAEKGISFSRHCEGCHDPVAMAAGAITDGAPRKRPYDQDGVTCMVCHSIKSVDTRGTGSYVLAEPAVLVDETGQPIHRPVSDGEILSHLDRHSAAVMKPLYKTPEFCSTCHKAALPHQLNDYKWQRAISLYDEWQNSSFAKESPLPFYKKDVVSTCQTCHMQREDLGSASDSGAKKNQLVSHRWLGANTVIPQIYHYPEQGEKVTAFLQNAVFNVDLFALEPEATASGQPALIAPLGMSAYTLTPGQRVTASVVIQNKGNAHSHVPEQRDMYESWVAFTVKDAAGKTIAESGFIQPGGELDESAHSFTNRLINKQGGINSLHQVWDNRVVAYNNTIQSGRSQLIRYAFTMPKSGPVTVTAAVRYRRFDQHFIDFGMSMPAGQHYQQPIVDMVSTTRTFAVGVNSAIKPLPNENPEWMRWNNYGIGLLDAQQYAGSVAAFEHVAKLRPDYPDAPTNIGLTYIQWEKYDEAMPYIEKSLALGKDNARALYYRALVERNQGQVDEAIVDLQKVAAQFPRSRDAHRELGFSYYQQHKYPLARAEYETVQSIDPDDLAAHYNLAILYRRLGLKDKATEQAAYFADQKDDPTASVYALEYLRKHHEIAQESVPWHVHDLDHKGKDEPLPATAASASATMAVLHRLEAPELLPDPTAQGGLH
ncbi:Tetratricopeptide TPR_1 repeat-containing protein (plasmid) [Granulicella tundricola MP5ACTX9]|uniref:Tetratricopeptide TPR_1 repeat-containing protein n=2 Tax=Granulicella TaxID=940557 RepID=E8X6A9_GRATM|nr:Tetratricopeptide TPR_1 repeat-containing protein [Granulicella tundricola MP5ACTX9]